MSAIKYTTDFKQKVCSFWNGLNQTDKQTIIKSIWNFNDPIVTNNFLNSDWDRLGSYNQRRVLKFYSLASEVKA